MNILFDYFFVYLELSGKGEKYESIVKYVSKDDIDCRQDILL